MAGSADQPGTGSQETQLRAQLDTLNNKLVTAYNYIKDRNSRIDLITKLANQLKEERKALLKEVGDLQAIFDVRSSSQATLPSLSDSESSGSVKARPDPVGDGSFVCECEFASEWRRTHQKWDELGSPTESESKLAARVAELAREVDSSQGFNHCPVGTVAVAKMQTFADVARECLAQRDEAWRRLRQAETEWKQQARDFEEERAFARDETGRQAANNAELTAKLNGLASQLRERDMQVAMFAEEVRQCRCEWDNALKQMRGREADLQERAQMLCAERDRLALESQGRAGRCAALESELSSLKEALSRSQTLHSEQDTKIRSLIDLAAKYRDQRDETWEKSIKPEDVDDLKRRHEKELRLQKARVEDLEEEVRACRGTIASLNKDLEALRQKNKDYDAEVALMRAELERARQAGASDVSEKDARITQLQQEARHYRAKIRAAAQRTAQLDERSRETEQALHKERAERDRREQDVRALLEVAEASATERQALLRELRERDAALGAHARLAACARDAARDLAFEKGAIAARLDELAGDLRQRDMQVGAFAVEMLRFRSEWAELMRVAMERGTMLAALSDQIKGLGLQPAAWVPSKEHLKPQDAEEAERELTSHVLGDLAHKTTAHKTTATATTVAVEPTRAASDVAKVLSQAIIKWSKSRMSLGSPRSLGLTGGARGDDVTPPRGFGAVPSPLPPSLPLPPPPSPPTQRPSPLPGPLPPPPPLPPSPPPTTTMRPRKTKSKTPMSLPRMDTGHPEDLLAMLLAGDAKDEAGKDDPLFARGDVVAARLGGLVYHSMVMAQPPDLAAPPGDTPPSENPSRKSPCPCPKKDGSETPPPPPPPSFGPEEPPSTSSTAPSEAGEDQVPVESLADLLQGMVRQSVWAALPSAEDVEEHPREAVHSILQNLVRHSVMGALPAPPPAPSDDSHHDAISELMDHLVRKSVWDPPPQPEDEKPTHPGEAVEDVLAHILRKSVMAEPYADKADQPLPPGSEREVATHVLGEILGRSFMASEDPLSKVKEQPSDGGEPDTPTSAKPSDESAAGPPPPPVPDDVPRDPSKQSVKDLLNEVVHRSLMMAQSPKMPPGHKICECRVARKAGGAPPGPPYPPPPDVPSSRGSSKVPSEAGVPPPPESDEAVESLADTIHNLVRQSLWNALPETQELKENPREAVHDMLQFLVRQSIVEGLPVPLPPPHEEEEKPHDAITGLMDTLLKNACCTAKPSAETHNAEPEDEDPVADVLAHIFRKSVMRAPEAVLPPPPKLDEDDPIAKFLMDVMNKLFFDDALSKTSSQGSQPSQGHPPEGQTLGQQVPDQQGQLAPVRSNKSTCSCPKSTGAAAPDQVPSPVPSTASDGHGVDDILTDLVHKSISQGISPQDRERQQIMDSVLDHLVRRSLAMVMSAGSKEKLPDDVLPPAGAPEPGRRSVCPCPKRGSDYQQQKPPEPTPPKPPEANAQGDAEGEPH